MNDQETFWSGDFGTQYTERNKGRVPANVAFFRKVLGKQGEIESIIEFGAGAGENLQALADLYPQARIAAVEINESAANQILLGVQNRLMLFVLSMLTFPAAKITDPWDLAFTKGVLIHIAPEDLPHAYDVLYHSSKRLILIAEYYSKTPREIEYRGHAGKLWTRDFGGEMLDRHPDLTLLDVAFHYDRTTGQDNITHWIMEKK